MTLSLKIYFDFHFASYQLRFHRIDKCNAMNNPRQSKFVDLRSNLGPPSVSMNSCGCSMNSWGIMTLLPRSSNNCTTYSKRVTTTPYACLQKWGDWTLEIKASLCSWSPQQVSIVYIMPTEKASNLNSIWKNEMVPAMSLNNFGHVSIICRNKDVTLQWNKIIQCSHLWRVILKKSQVLWIQ